jgi:hypothetical protein
MKVADYKQPRCLDDVPDVPDPEDYQHEAQRIEDPIYYPSWDDRDDYDAEIEWEMKS